MSKKLIVGLGNPGSEYKLTRHNAGFMVLDKLSETLNLKFDNFKFNGEFVKSEINNDQFILAKPLTFMNLSGNFVRELCDFYKIWPQNILVVYDEMSFNIGAIKLRVKGSGGGHNGMQNVINRMGTEKIKRLRIGIGSNNITDKAKYVLSKFRTDEMVYLDTAIANSVAACYQFLNNINFDNIMNTFNNNGKK